MDFVTETLLPLLATALIPLLAAGLGYLIQAGTRALRGVADDAESSAMAKLAASVGDRVLSAIDLAIDDAASQTQGTLAKFRRPESDGGERITAAEWQMARLELAASVAAGFGRPWLERFLTVMTGDRPDPSVSTGELRAAARPILASVLESRYAERVDMALASGIRTAAPVPPMAAPATSSLASPRTNEGHLPSPSSPPV